MAPSSNKYSKQRSSAVSKQTDIRRVMSGFGRGGGTDVIDSNRPKISQNDEIAPFNHPTTPMVATPTVPDQFKDINDNTTLPSVMDTTTTPTATALVTSPEQMESEVTTTPCDATTQVPTDQSLAAIPLPNVTPAATNGNPPHPTIDTTVETLTPANMQVDPPTPPRRISTQAPLRNLNPHELYIGTSAGNRILPSPQSEHYGRYTWRVHAPASDSPILSLVAAIKEIWEVLLAADPTLVIYPWAEQAASNPSKAMFNPDLCPKTTRDLLPYFHKAFPRLKGGTFYIQVRMGHTVAPSELHRATAHFFDLPDNKYRVGYWYRSLQYDSTVEIGWLLGSTSTMSPERLAAEVLFRSHGKLEIGCRWHMISLQSFNPDLPQNLRFKAMHIEVKESQQKSAWKYLCSLFSSSRTSDYVYGTYMRLVPLIGSCSQPDTVAKCARLRERQGVFSLQVKSTRVFTLNNIDFRSPRLDSYSMRDLIMKIKTRDGSGRNLFISCDYQRFDQSVVMTFLNKHSTEAYSVSQNLLAFLRFTNPVSYTAGINHGFIPDEVDRARDVEWDPVNQCVLTAADVQMDDFEDSLLDDDFAFDESIKQKILLDMRDFQAQSNNVTRAREEGPREDDSVSTFRSTKKARRETPPNDDASTNTNSTPQTSGSRSSVTRGARSSHSDISMDSRVLVIEDRITGLHEAMLRLEQVVTAGFQNQSDSGTSPPL